MGRRYLQKTKQVVDREWLQTYSELEELPSFFRPINHVNYGLAKSTSRNQTLFEYILVQIYNFSRDEIRKTIKLINDHILYEPLTDKEG